MATVNECRRALEKVASRITEMSAQDRQRHLVDRTISFRVTDLGVDFRTRLGPHGTDPISEAAPHDGPAQVTFSARSDDLVALADEQLHLRPRMGHRAPQDPGERVRPAQIAQHPLTCAAFMARPSWLAGGGRDVAEYSGSSGGGERVGHVWYGLACG